MRTLWNPLSSRLVGAALALGLLSVAAPVFAQSAEIAPPPQMNPAAAAATAATHPAGTPSPSSGIYRWKDANGKVHFGDRAPPHAERVNVRNDAPSPEAAQAAQERLQAMQQRSDELAAQRRAQNAPAEGSTNTAPTQQETPPNESACQTQWRLYHESYACFNPYRQANGSVNAEGFKHCKSMIRPSCTP